MEMEKWLEQNHYFVTPLGAVSDIPFRHSQSVWSRSDASFALAGDGALADVVDAIISRESPTDESEAQNLWRDQCHELSLFAGRYCSGVKFHNPSSAIPHTALLQYPRKAKEKAFLAESEDIPRRFGSTTAKQ
jgi:hypothetical protein